MINTLFASGLLNTPLGFAAALALGLCFGLCLERAGLGSSRRLAAVFYLKDMTVVKVMFSAMVTAMLGLVAAENLGLVSLSAIHLLPTMLVAQALGGALLGLGFAMAGWCPGTAAVGLGSGRLDALVYLLGLLIGSVAFNESFPFLQPLTVLGDRGVVFAYQSLGLPKELVVYGFVGLAVLFFWLSEMIERGPRLSRPGVAPLFLAQFCAVLAVAAFLAVNLPRLAGGPAQTAFTGRAGIGLPAGSASDESRLLADIATGKDHIEPEELAERLRGGDPALFLVDIRSAQEFAAFHLKGAVNIPMADLPQALAPRKNQGIIVLYSNGMTHPAQARDALARLGFGNAYMLTGGLTGFFEHCLKPASLRDGPVSAEQAAAITTWREYFLPQSIRNPAGLVGPAQLALPATVPGLADPAWLADNLGKPGLKVVDLRPQPQYNSGHIPGSLSLQLESLRGNLGGMPSMLLPPAMLLEHLAQMGIAPRDLVAIVPGENPQDGTLLAVALERAGHQRYVLIDGGMKAWTAANLPKNTLLPTVVALPLAQAATPDTFTVDGRFVLDALKDGKSVIIDVRPAEYYAGTASDEARPGHMPGAVSRPFTEDQAKAQNGVVRLKPVAELEKAYAALIPAKNHPVIIHCRTGHQASQTWWVLTRLLGYTNVKYYDASWTEWGAHPDWPVVATPQEGSAKPEAKTDKKP